MSKELERCREAIWGCLFLRLPGLGISCILYWSHPYHDHLTPQIENVHSELVLIVLSSDELEHEIQLTLSENECHNKH